MLQRNFYLLIFQLTVICTAQQQSRLLWLVETILVGQNFVLRLYDGKTKENRWSRLKFVFAKNKNWPCEMIHGVVNKLRWKVFVFFWQPTPLKVRKSRNDIFKPTFLIKIERTNSTLLLWNLRLTCFCLFFGRNWRHQKDISKLTDLYTARTSASWMERR